MAGKNWKHQELSPEACLALQRGADGWRLRQASLTFAQIGVALGITEEGARPCVKRAAAKVRAELEESPADYKLAMLERNIQVKAKFFERALRGDDRAAQILLSYEKEMAALIGLYPPKVEVKSTLTPEELEALDQELLELWRLHVAEEEKKRKREKD